MSILIVSDESDISEITVMHWLSFYGYDYLKLIFNDLKKIRIDWELDNKTNKIILINNDEKIDIKSAWFRKDSSTSSFTNKLGKSFKEEVQKHSKMEIETIKKSLFSSNTDINWLSEYNAIFIDKLKVLHLASKVGINIPKTIITNDKHVIKTFFANNKPIICKAAYENISYIKTKNGYLKQFVEEVDNKFLDNLPDMFFPSLFQQKIPKEYDVRVFYLNGKCYSMAIFNQRTDFRADYENHRNVPLKLPNSLEEKILNLMEDLDLNTGSIDFIKSSHDGQFYFLEVNPTGQFGMVSYPCNYYLEREIAKYLSYVT